MTYRGHHVLATLIRAYFSPLHSTAQRYIYAGSHDGTVYIYGTNLPGLSAGLVCLLGAELAVNTILCTCMVHTCLAMFRIWLVSAELRSNTLPQALLVECFMSMACMSSSHWLMTLHSPYYVYRSHLTIWSVCWL